jgi:hypothetical protein
MDLTADARLWMQLADVASGNSIRSEIQRGQADLAKNRYVARWREIAEFGLSLRSLSWGW